MSFWNYAANRAAGHAKLDTTKIYILSDLPIGQTDSLF